MHHLIQDIQVEQKGITRTALHFPSEINICKRFVLTISQVIQAELPLQTSDLALKIQIKSRSQRTKVPRPRLLELLSASPPAIATFHAVGRSRNQGRLAEKTASRPGREDWDFPVVKP